MKKKLRLKGLFLAMTLAFFGMANIQAQELEPVEWEVTVTNVDADEILLSYKATIDEHWHIYALQISDDADAFGPMPTEMIIEPNDALITVGDPEEISKPISAYDKAFDMDLYFHEKTAEFCQKIKVNEKGEINIKGEVVYMACDDEKCIFPDPLKVDINIKE